MSAYKIPVITIVWIHQDPTAAIAILDGSIEKIGNIVKVIWKIHFPIFFINIIVYWLWGFQADFTLSVVACHQSRSITNLLPLDHLTNSSS